MGKIKLENIIPLQVDWDYHFDYNHVHPNHRSVMAKLYGNEEYPIAIHEPQSNMEMILKPVDDHVQQDKLMREGFQEFVVKVFLMDVSIEYETGLNEEFVSDRRYIMYFFHNLYYLISQ